MNEEDANRNISVSVPMGAIGAILLLGAAAAAYTLLNRNDNSEGSSSPSKPRGNMRRRLGLMTLVTLLENDATRRVVIAMLKAMARRS